MRRLSVIVCMLGSFVAQSGSASAASAPPTLRLFAATRQTSVSQGELRFGGATSACG